MRLFVALFILVFFPVYVFADSVCLDDGYTVLTINGVSTNEQGAQNNKEALLQVLGRSYNGEPLKVDFLLNPSHLGGALDIADAIRQKVFSQTSDYDLVEMLNDASDKITTQKVLLVAHSQGNFYANNFYDTVVGQQGGIPVESIGVYGVASPSDHVAGGGLYLTSSTDNVINTLRTGGILNILKANTDIELSPRDTAFDRGHSFSGVYIPNKGARIVADIQASLGKLSSDPERREDVRCLDLQELSITHKALGTTLFALDGAADSLIYLGGRAYAFGTTVGEGIHLAQSYTEDLIAKAFIYAFVAIAGIANDTAGTSTANPAAVFLATQNPPKQQEVTAAIVPSNNPIIIQNSSLVPDKEPSVLPPPKQNTQQAVPRLVFMGNPQSYPGFGGGAPAIQEPQVLSYQSGPETNSVPTVDQIPDTKIIPAPSITARECTNSLVSPGCLITDQNVSFLWDSIDGAVYYSVSKNGTYATTTSIYLDATIPDFSDYDITVAAVDSSGKTSATSTLRVSVASIPIAINEIAWMGTEDSSSDEWMELKNNTNYTIDLSNWQLASDDKTPSVTLSGSIKPYGYILLERTNDTTIRDIPADIIYSGSLKNSGEILRLAHASSTLDQTPSGVWAAGSNTDSFDRRTMERISPRNPGSDATNWATWGSNVEFIRNGEGVDGATILGTPGARNSVNYVSLNNGEDITATTTLPRDSGYYIPYAITVASSTTLTIEEGVDIVASDDLNIEGVIDVKGTSQNPVHFTGSPDSSGASNPQIFIDNIEATSTFSHMVMDGMYGITADSGNVVIGNSEFNNNQFGVVLFNGSTATITDTKFSTTTEGEVLSAYNGSTLSIASSTIRDTLNNGAIEVFDGSVLDIATTTISGISWGNGIKVYNATATLNNVTIEDVEKGDGLNLTDSTTTVVNTSIEHGSDDAVGIFGGSATIKDSSISDFPNGAGVRIDAPIEPVIIQNTTISGTETPIETYGSPADVVVLP